MLGSGCRLYAMTRQGVSANPVSSSEKVARFRTKYWRICSFEIRLGIFLDEAVRWPVVMPFLPFLAAIVVYWQSLNYRAIFPN
jgi:hypothetical protein